MTRKTWIASALAAVLAVSAVFPGAAAEPAGRDKAGEKPLFAVRPVGSLSLGGGRLELSEAYIMPGDEGGERLSMAIRLVNGSAGELDLFDYALRLRWKGASLPVKWLPRDKEQHELPAYSERTFVAYADLPTGASWPELSLEAARWDFSQPGFERKIGAIAFPSDYSAAAPGDARRSWTEGPTVLAADVDRVTALERGEDVGVHVYVNMKNEGRFPLDVPAYDYYLRFGKKTFYPLEAAASGVLRLEPGKSRQVQLRADVPSSVFADDMELWIVRRLPLDGQRTLRMPVALFDVSGSRSGAFDTVQAVPVSVGRYDYRLKTDSVQRLPWEDKDILAVRLLLENPGASAAPVPRLSAYFELDKGVRVDGVVVVPGERVGVEAGGAVPMYAYAKVPYAFRFAESSLVLAERASAEGTGPALAASTGSAPVAERELVRLNLPVEEKAWRIVPVSGEIVRELAGRTVALKAGAPRLYESDAGVLAAIPVVLENREKRALRAPELAGYLLAGDGSAYPVSVWRSGGQTTPAGGRALYWFSSEVPAGFTAGDGLQLLVGEAAGGGLSVGSTGGTAASGQPDAYLNAVGLALGSPAAGAANRLSGLDVDPYVLSIRNLKANFTNFYSYEWTVEFQYELRNETLPGVAGPERDIVLEFRNRSGELVFEKKLALGARAADRPSLELGKGDIRLVFNDPAAFRSYSGPDYTLNVYEEYRGYRRLLASRTIGWGVSSD